MFSNTNTTKTLIFLQWKAKASEKLNTFEEVLKKIGNIATLLLKWCFCMDMCKKSLVLLVNLCCNSFFFEGIIYQSNKVIAEWSLPIIFLIMQRYFRRFTSPVGTRKRWKKPKDGRRSPLYGGLCFRHFDDFLVQGNSLSMKIPMSRVLLLPSATAGWDMLHLPTLSPLSTWLECASQPITGGRRLNSAKRFRWRNYEEVNGCRKHWERHEWRRRAVGGFSLVRRRWNCCRCFADSCGGLRRRMRCCDERRR